MAYWNGEPTDARLVWLTVSDDPSFPLYWAKRAGLIGQRIKAVEVEYGGETFYLDDRDGEGWFKVTQGRGGPSYAHRNVLPVAGSVVPREPNLVDGFQQ